MNYDFLEKYAGLIVKVGANVQEGQVVIVNLPVNGQELGELIVKQCYLAGASDVLVFNDNEQMRKIRLLYGRDEAVVASQKAIVDLKLEYLKKGACVISLFSPDPDLMADVDSVRLRNYITTGQKDSQEYRSFVMQGGTSWSLAAHPNKKWAQKVFSDLEADYAEAALWEDIFDICRISEADPVEAWNSHLAELAKKTDYLNSKNISKLKYSSATADLEILLPKGHLWVGGINKNRATGLNFLPNIPTEEVFTAPLKGGVNGKVRSTKPLIYSGRMIDDFEIELKDGKIVNYSAAKGLDTLETIIQSDEGASFLGEVAIVPFSSPISKKNRIFHNTLFDENASCHLAIGNAYNMCLNPDSGNSSDINTSMTHVDFMVGSADLQIEATCENGEKFFVLKDGEWAI
ncbi:MAG: aminopeptidase [Spirochaetales bacterium]|nr:aminopeptidase [Spirochaetales bacterium]